MTPHDLIAAFDAVAEAADGVERLRELVFRLAVHGRLVPQDPTDEPASVRLAGRVLSFSLEDVPFSLPGGWAWSSFGKLGSLLGGGTPSKDSAAFWDGDIPWVTPKDMKRDIIADSQDHITEAAVAKSSVKRVPPGALLMVVRGMILAHSFPTALTKTAVTINQDMKALVPFDGKIGDFLLLVTKGLKPNVLSLVERSTHGTCKLPTDELFQLPLPIAPWAEQRRIIARVDELMGLLDRLEAARTSRDATRAAFRDSALDALREADTPDEVEVAWNRFAERIDDLLCDPADIAPLRQVVLQLVVRGRLVPQDPGDEPASALLARIAVEKARLVKAGSSRKRGPLPSVSQNDVPFDLPDGWCWARFADVARIASNLVDPAEFRSEPHVAPDNIEKATGRLLGYRTIGEDGVTSGKHRFSPGQILYSKIRPNLSKVVTVDFAGLCSADMYPIDSWINWAYLHRFMLSQLFLDQITSDDNRLAMPKVNQEQLSAIHVPVPPLAEQHRIVARVDELMSLLDRLEERLAAARTAHTAFAAAAVHHLDA